MNESDKGKETNAEHKESNQSKNQTSDKQTMNGNQNNNSNNQTGGMNVPDWVMHLLTGAGSMGGSYLLFIKPLQEKFDDLQKQISKQEEKIEDLEEQLEQLLKSSKKEQNKEQPIEGIKQEKQEELFNVKRKTPNSNLSGAQKSVRF